MTTADKVVTFLVFVALVLLIVGVAKLNAKAHQRLGIDGKGEA